MMTKQLCGIHHYNKSNLADRHMSALIKRKRVELEDKIEAYFSHHPFVLWAIIFWGVPIWILLAVGLTITIFGLMILGIMSLM